VQRIIRAYDAHKERMDQMQLALETSGEAKNTSNGRAAASADAAEFEGTPDSVLD
jgi:hypothetical protein